MSIKPSKFSSNKPVSSPAQSCPLQENRVIPCDLGGLQLSGKDGDGNSSTSLANEPRKDRSNPRSVKDLPHQDDPKYYKVESYDTILELLAQPFSSQNLNVTGTQVSASITTIIGSCPKQEHPVVLLNHPSFDNNDQLPKSLEVVNKSMAPREVFAKKLPFDDITSHDVRKKTLISEFLYMFKDKSNYVKEIKVVGKACGVRDDGTKPVRQLKGLIRVYRDDKYNLKLTLPSMWSSTYSVTKGLDGKTTSTEKNYKSDLEFTIVENKHGVIDSASVTKKENSYKKISVSSDSPSTTPSSTTTSIYNSPVTFALTCNGRHLIGNEFLEQLIATYLKFKKGLDVLEELKESIPKVGVGYSLKWDALIGEVNGDWGLETGSKLDTAEYKWVQPFGTITLALKLFTIDFELSFGVECKSPSILNWFKRPVFELIIKVALAIKTECKIDTVFTLVGNNKREIKQIGDTSDSAPKDYDLATWTFDVDAEFYAQGKVTVFGEGVDTKFSTVGGLTISAKAVYPFGIRGKGEWKEIYLSAYFTHFKRKQSKPWKKVIMKKRDMFTERYILR